MPIVNLKISKGARRAEKAQIVAEFTDTLRRVLGKGTEHIHVVIDEVDEANWGYGGMLTDEYRASAPAPAAVAPTPVYAPPPPPPVVYAPAPAPPPVYHPPPVQEPLLPPPPPPLFAQAAPAPPAPQPVFVPPPAPAPAPQAAPEPPVQSEPDPDAPPPRVMMERTPGAKEEEIYVDMVSGGFACLRSVMAENLGREVYRIVENMPENEAWKYGPGAVVRVKKQKLSTGKAWVAYEAVQLQEVR